MGKNKQAAPKADKVTVEPAQARAQAFAAKMEAKKKKLAAERAAFVEKAHVKLAKLADEYSDLDSVGKIVPFTEKNGTVAPSLVIGTREVCKVHPAGHKDEGQKVRDEDGAEVLESRVRVLVFSLERDQPYPADYPL